MYTFCVFTGQGKVPRNEYGNVELFKPWMLPLGTVQVRGRVDNLLSVLCSCHDALLGFMYLPWCAASFGNIDNNGSVLCICHDLLLSFSKIDNNGSVECVSNYTSAVFQGMLGLRKPNSGFKHWWNITTMGTLQFYMWADIKTRFSHISYLRLLNPILSTLWVFIRSL